MAANALNREYSLKLSLADILALIKNFRIEDKIIIEKELEKETLLHRAKQLSKRIKTNKISLDEIVSETRVVRKSKKNEK